MFYMFSLKPSHYFCLNCFFVSMIAFIRFGRGVAEEASNPIWQATCRGEVVLDFWFLHWISELFGFDDSFVCCCENQIISDVYSISRMVSNNLTHESKLLFDQTGHDGRTLQKSWFITMPSNIFWNNIHYPSFIILIEPLALQEGTKCVTIPFFRRSGWMTFLWILKEVENMNCPFDGLKRICHDYLDE